MEFGSKCARSFGSPVDCLKSDVVPVINMTNPTASTRPVHQPLDISSSTKHQMRWLAPSLSGIAAVYGTVVPGFDSQRGLFFFVFARLGPHNALQMKQLKPLKAAATATARIGTGQPRVGALKLSF